MLISLKYQILYLIHHSNLMLSTDALLVQPFSAYSYCYSKSAMYLQLADCPNSINDS